MTAYSAALRRGIGVRRLSVAWVVDGYACEGAAPIATFARTLFPWASQRRGHERLQLCGVVDVSGELIVWFKLVRNEDDHGQQTQIGREYPSLEQSQDGPRRLTIHRLRGLWRKSATNLPLETSIQRNGALGLRCTSAAVPSGLL